MLLCGNLNLNHCNSSNVFELVQWRNHSFRKEDLSETFPYQISNNFIRIYVWEDFCKHTCLQLYQSKWWTCINVKSCSIISKKGFRILGGFSCQLHFTSCCHESEMTKTCPDTCTYTTKRLLTWCEDMQ